MHPVIDSKEVSHRLPTKILSFDTCGGLTDLGACLRLQIEFFRFESRLEARSLKIYSTVYLYGTVVLA